MTSVSHEDEVTSAKYSLQENKAAGTSHTYPALLFLQCLITPPDRNRSSTYEEIKMKPGPTLMSFERSLRHLSHHDGEEQWSNVWTEGDESTQWRHRGNVEAPRGLQCL